MDYKQKYLKYKAKYLEAKAKLDGGLFGDANSSVNNNSKNIEKHTRNISVLEQAIKGRTNKIRNTEDQKKRGIENLTKNNAPKTEIDDVIKMYDSDINGVKKEIEIKTRELEKEKKLLEKAKKMK